MKALRRHTLGRVASGTDNAAPPGNVSELGAARQRKPFWRRLYAVSYPAANARTSPGCIPFDIGASLVAAVCDICGKGPGFGNSISHSHRRTRRRWNPNIQTVRAVVGRTPKRLAVCTSCLKAGRITR